jgi:hypothetical protein
LKKKWKNAGWNGIQLKIPQGWEPGEIGRRYLLFENSGRPVLELKWGLIKGRFAPKAVLRKLAPAKSRRQAGAFSECPLPALWQPALTGFQSYGFHWRYSAMTAKGLLIYCPVCNTATLIQFFQPKGTAALDENVPVRVLESLRDHGKGDKRLWTLYDIRADVPTGFDLADFQFRTGHFMLSFKRGKEQLYLRRWSPASVFLNRQSLEAFAVENMSVPKAGHRVHIHNMENAVSGTFGPVESPPVGFGWVKRLFKKKRYQTWRVWQLPERNRILAVSLEDAKPIDNHRFHQITSAYGIVC